MSTFAYCVCGCHRPAEFRHHVVYQQHLKRAGGDCGDPRGMVPIAGECHERHHTGARRLTLHCLPDDAIAFAVEVLGLGPAINYLRRRYAGDDARLDDLLAEWWEASGLSSRLVGGETA